MMERFKQREQSQIQLNYTTNEMELYKATEDDIWIIQSLAKRIWPATFGNLMTETQMAYMMDMMYSSASLQEQIGKLGHNYLLAKDNDEFLGYASYETNYKGKNRIKIHKIYLLPSAQGKGIGRFLINSIADIAKANGCEELTLNMKRDNEAIDFYHKMNFDICGEEDIDIGNGFLMQDYILNKKI